MECIFFEYPKCTTCKKAKKFLDTKEVKYIDKNIVTETPTYDELSEWIEKSGLPISKFFNTSGLLYRNMNLKEELKNATDEEKIRLLASDGMLIKRPIFISKDKILLGFKEEEWSKIK